MGRKRANLWLSETQCFLRLTSRWWEVPWPVSGKKKNPSEFSCSPCVGMREDFRFLSPCKDFFSPAQQAELILSPGIQRPLRAPWLSPAGAGSGAARGWAAGAVPAACRGRLPSAWAPSRPVPKPFSSGAAHKLLRAQPVFCWFL